MHEITLRFRDNSTNEDFVATCQAEEWEVGDDSTLRLVLSREQYESLWDDLKAIRVVDGRPVAFFSSSSSWACAGTMLQENLYLSGAHRQNPDISVYLYVDGDYRKEVA